nr:MAG TPA: hypothetical protein [Caudoviricetes sp.]
MKNSHFLPRSQRRGQGFDPLIVHHNKTLGISMFPRVFSCLIFVNNFKF